MPIIETESCIYTKVTGVCEESRQRILLTMYHNPELVIELSVENMIVSALVEINGSPVREIIGNIKEKYFAFLHDKIIRIKQWRITGGGRLEGYGSRCRNLGINITLYY